MPSTRRLAAVLAADVAGYSRLMGEDEEGTLAALKAIWRELSDPKIKEHRGRLVKTALQLPPMTPGQTAATPLPLPEKPSIAVLPFQNMSGDAEQEYFVDGMVEDIITALSRNRAFFVISRNTTFTYKGSAVDVGKVARELGVRYVLEGSVRRAGNRVRITAQLIDAASGHHLWADRYDRELADVFAVQDEIARSITGAIAPGIIAAEIQQARRK